MSAHLEYQKFTYHLPLKRSFFGITHRQLEIWQRGETMVEYAPFPHLHNSKNENTYKKYLHSEFDFLDKRWQSKRGKDIFFHALISEIDYRLDWEYYRKFNIIKLKLARQDLHQELDFLQFLLKELPQTKFRIDTNRLWSENDLKLFTNQVPLTRVDYFEEPTPNSLDLSQEFPIAFDETLIEVIHSEKDLDLLKSARAIVVKPHLLPHINSFLKIVKWGSCKKIPVVISSLFNSSVGTQNLLRLACLVQEGTVHGFDPFGYMGGDSVENPLLPTGPCFPREEIVKPLKLSYPKI